MLKQNGFVLPLTLMVVFIMVTMIMTVAMSYKAEMHFVSEQQKMLSLDRLEQMAYIDIYNKYSDGDLLEKESFHYREGQVTLTLYSSQSFQRTFLVIETCSPNYQRKNWLIVDDRTHHIIRWEKGS